MPPKLNPQTPGEVQQETEAVEAAPAAAETVTVPKDQFDAVLARLAKLESRPAAPAPKVSEENLPDQDSVDPDKIKQPILTKQGWVVPTKYGSNPNQPK